MRTILPICALMCAVSCLGSQTPGVPQAARGAEPRRPAAAFVYRPASIEPGTVYHYVKSNIDGSRPANVTVYIASRSHLEVLKLYPNTDDGINVTADMDWTKFEPDHLMQWAVHKDGTRSLQLSAWLTDEGRTFKLLAANESGSASTLDVPIRDHPLHIYSFDFTSLNFVFRHLRNPNGVFEVGTIGLASRKVANSGRVNIRYVRDEMRHQVMCRVYRASGPGIENTQGTIWVNRQFGHVEDMEFPFADTRGWTSFKFELKSIEQMNDFTWNQWVTSQVKALP